MGCTPRAERQVKTMFIPVPEANYTQAKAHCPIILFFMQKKMQKLVARNIRNESLGYVLYIYTNLPTNQGKNTETAMHHVITHIQEKAENKEITMEFS